MQFRLQPNEPKMLQCSIAAAVLFVHLLAALRAETPAATHRTPDTLGFHAGELVDAKLLRGPDYTVDDFVPVVDDRYLFTFRTSAGSIDAHGMGMLQIRVDEMRALERAKALDAKPQEVEGVKDSIKQTGEGLKGLVTDPGETLGNIPRGLGRKLKSLTHKDKGGGDTRRQFAAAVKCDPETDNPPLKKILDKLAIRRNIGRAAIDVAGFAATGGAANLAMVARGAGALRTTAEMNDLVRSTPLYKINQQIRDELAGMDVPQKDREAFIEHRGTTTVQRLLFMQQYRRVCRVPGSPLLIEMALEIPDRAEFVGFIRAVELLAQLNDRYRITSIFSSDQPVARLADGSVVCVNSADYLTDSAELKTDAPSLRQRHPRDSLILLISGKASPEARRTLLASRIRVLENGDIADLARAERR